MDLHFTTDKPNSDEVAAVDLVLGPEPQESRTTAGILEGVARHQLLPVLHAINGRIGWISPGALNYACRRLGVPPAEAYGVADFYDLFSMSWQPGHVLRVCDDIACQCRGANDLCQQLEEQYGPAGSLIHGGEATWLRNPCLGLCERAPAALVSQAGRAPISQSVAPLGWEDAEACLRGEGTIISPVSDVSISVPQHDKENLQLLQRIETADPLSLASYRAHGGCRALEKAIEKGSEWVVEQVLAAKLVGRGGAAFPTGRKWKAVAEAVAPKYLICNADESEPGTFKDRVLMDGDPFAVIEAMAIAAFTTHCTKAFIYIRGEYPLAAERLQNAIDVFQLEGLMAQSCDIELRIGAGAYICGEETALFNSIEGFRGEPRNKPPYPTEAGLFGRPTLVNNVETLANIPRIILHGGESFAGTGTVGSTGSKLFCLSGHVEQPGVYEASFGVTVRDLINLAGGVSGTGKLQTVLVGGAAGSFLIPEEIDTPFTFEGMRGIGATVGSAVVMVFDDSVRISRILRRIAQFFREESCGQCVPCRVGTVRQDELLQRLERMQPLGSLDREQRLLEEIGQVMRDASICGLGHTASSAVESALVRLSIVKGMTNEST